MDVKKMAEMLSDLPESDEPPFKTFDALDWDSFAGAESGSLIAHGAKHVFILSPTKEIIIVEENGHEHVFRYVET